MHVRLVSYSRPTEEFGTHGIEDAQDLVAFCARVSNPSNQFNTDTSEKLIRYLVRNQHWSPLEMVSACMEITTTRDIARQMLRHRSFSFQEFSQRYADPVKDLAFELRHARLQDTTNRQNSIELDLANPEHALLSDLWIEKQQDVIRAAREAYSWAILNGIAKEQARCVLPEGNTQSRLYMNGTLRSWVHFVELRSANGTQLEHQDIARACAEVIALVFPMANEFVAAR
jgi:thymidylate synthase (FAD)